MRAGTFLSLDVAHYSFFAKVYQVIMPNDTGHVRTFVDREVQDLNSLIKSFHVI